MKTGSVPGWFGCRDGLTGLLVVLGLFLVQPPACATNNQAALILGIHPYLAPATLELRFAPLAHYLAEVLQSDVRVRVGRNYREHMLAIGEDRIDVAYLGPATYVTMQQRFGPKPLLARLERNGRPVLTGAIVVRGDSPVQSLADLRGKAFAFGDPASTMSSLVPKAVLLEAGIGLDDLAWSQAFPGHTNVAMAVLSGQVDAGAVKTEVADEFSSHGLRVLQDLPPISEHLFVTRADLPVELVERLRSTLLGLGDTHRGRQILRDIHRDATGLVPVHETDYDNLRSLLGRLSDGGGASGDGDR